MPVTTLGQRIREARECAQIRHVDFARLVGTTANTLWKWESDTNPPRSTEKLVQIADALGITLDWLIAGKGPAPRRRKLQGKDVPAKARGAA